MLATTPMSRKGTTSCLSFYGKRLSGLLKRSVLHVVPEPLSRNGREREYKVEGKKVVIGLEGEGWEVVE